MCDNGDWKVFWDKKFQLRFKKYKRDNEVCKALAACVGALAAEKDPVRLGDRKYGRYAGAYGYNLSKPIRVIYKVDYDVHRIRLVALGDHKEAYGSD